MNKKAIYLSVIIPAYNENKLIINTIISIEDYFFQRKYIFEVIVVNDASTDNTKNLVEGLKKTYNNITLISNQMNMGKGYSVKRGMEIAEGDYRLFMDADNSTSIDQIESFLQAAKEGYDVSIGNRKLKNSTIRTRQSFYKEILGIIGNYLIHFFAISDIKDTKCGFKLFTKQAAMKVFPKLTINRWGFDIEALALANQYGLKIKSIPVSWINRKETKVKLSDYVKTFGELLKIKIN